MHTCTYCKKTGHFSDRCSMNPHSENSKTVLQGKQATEISMKRIADGTSSVKKVNISRNYQIEMKQRQNMTDLGHEE